MRFSAKSAVGVLAVAALVLAGCAQTAQRPPETRETASTGDANNFGGAPAVEIPSDAKAMSAFLIAETANNDNDREGALKGYEDAVHYDPTNAQLRVRLATLYVRDGRLKEALNEANEALKVNPNSVDARLL